jgi:hypothetical protein
MVHHGPTFWCSTAARKYFFTTETIIICEFFTWLDISQSKDDDVIHRIGVCILDRNGP